MEQGLHPRLIQANIALFKGDRAEALRLTQSYRAERIHRPENDPNLGMVLWLEAQAQADTFVRIDALHTLVATMPPNDPYVQMAQDYLQLEDRYQTRLNPSRRRSRAFWVVSFVTVLIVVIIVAGVVISGMNNEETPPDDIQTVVDSDSVDVPTPMPTRYPDRSIPLTIEDHTSRYPGGILEISAYEYGSERVLDDNFFTLVSPVQGAYFLALRVIFECRIGICNAPPEADLRLLLESGDMITIREDVMIANEPILEPLALGHTTTGWIIFEIPLISEVEALVILPSERETDDEQAMIPLRLPR